MENLVLKNILLYLTNNKYKNKRNINMRKTYKILVNISGVEKVHKICFDNRDYRSYYDKPPHQKINTKFITTKKEN